MNLSASRAELFAAGILVLAATPASKAAKAGEKSRKKMMSLVDPQAKKARKSMEKAAKSSITVISKALAADPKADIESLLKKAAISNALSKPFTDIEGDIHALIKTVYVNAYQAGVQSGIEELKAAGKKVGSVEFTIDPKAYKVYQDDVSDNADSAGERLANVLRAYGGEKTRVAALASALRNLVNRAQYSVEAAGKQGFNDGKLALMKASGATKVRWVTRFGPGTCKFCADLHGKIVTLGQPFKTDFPLNKKYGKLTHPPVHPNCNCVVVFEA